MAIITENLDDNIICQLQNYKAHDSLDGFPKWQSRWQPGLHVRDSPYDNKMMMPVENPDKKTPDKT
jgi:hypothetical protein